MTTSQEQSEAQRHKKQQWIRRQVKAGKLVVRQMTPDERAKFPRSEVGQGGTLGRDRQRPDAPRSRGPVPPERLGLYRARAYGSDTTTPGRLRELERASAQAEQRLGSAREKITAE